MLHCGTNTLEATPEHPLWVAGEGWKAAGQIQVGDELWTRSGEGIRVTALTHKQGQFTVYNFEVEDAHSYFVGRDGYLAHNKCQQLWLFERHHALSKFLGGDPAQLLTELSKLSHQELHLMIRAKLEEAGFTVVRNNKFISSREWEALLRDPEKREKAFNALVDATREFDEKGGTSVLHDLWNNVLKQNAQEGLY